MARNTFAMPFTSYIAGYTAADQLIGNNKRLRSQLRNEELQRALNEQNFRLNEQLNPLKVSQERMRDALSRYYNMGESTIPSDSLAAREFEARIKLPEAQAETQAIDAAAFRWLTLGDPSGYVQLYADKGMQATPNDDGLAITTPDGKTTMLSWDDLARGNPESFRRAVIAAQIQGRGQSNASGTPTGLVSSMFGLGGAMPSGTPAAPTASAAPTPSAPAAPMPSASAAPTEQFNPSMLYDSSIYRSAGNYTDQYSAFDSEYLRPYNTRVERGALFSRPRPTSISANRLPPYETVTRLRNPADAFPDQFKLPSYLSPIQSNISTPQLSQPTLSPIIEAISRVESGNNPNAVSPRGAIGIMQVMPNTAVDPGLGVKSIFDMADEMGIPYSSRTLEEAKRLLFIPELNVKFGSEYYNALLRNFGDEDAALAAYNYGPRRIKSNLAANQGILNLAALPKETRDYIPKVRAALAEIQQKDNLAAY
jgi:soluble lytic murein transglycosylase-like protein